MRYFGSKTSTLDPLEKLITERIPGGSFCDCFGGVGTVGAKFKALGFRVVTGDMLLFAHYFQVARVQQDGELEFLRLRAAHKLGGSHEVATYLNGLVPSDGWIVAEYARNRSFFTVENAMRIQACWNSIVEWDRSNLLTGDERATLIASLIERADRVANTAGTYYAFLKNFTRKALQSFEFQLLKPTPGLHRCSAFLGDAECLVEREEYDVLYLDPPYNGRVYSRYYHLPETLAHGEVPSELSGKAGLPVGEKQFSAFNRRRTALDALDILLRKARFRLLVFHYADDGLIEPGELRERFGRFRRFDEYLLTSKGYSVQRTSRTVDHRVYLIENG